MIFKKKLITDISAGQIRNVTNILKENSIAYDVKTIIYRPSGSREFNATVAAQYNQNSYNDTQYIYVVSVKFKDFQRAKDLLP